MNQMHCGKETKHAILVTNLQVSVNHVFGVCCPIGIP